MIALHFPKLSGYVRTGEICTIATPHAQGALKCAQDACVFDSSGPVPSQSRATALWPDGSVKWLLTHFMADLPANKGTDAYYLDKGVPAAPAQPARAALHDGAARIDTGALCLTLGGPGQPVFESARFAGGAFDAQELTGPAVTVDGQDYQAFVGPEGWQIVEAGPVRTIVQTSGKHTGAGGEKLDFDLLIYAYAGKPYVQVEYRFLHREAAQTLSLTGMGLNLTPKTAGESCVIGHSNYATRFIKSQGEEISHLIDQDYLLYTSNEQMPQVNFGAYFADWKDQTRGLCVSVFQAFQNFPKGFHVSKSGMQVELIPQGWGDITVAQGMARTQKMLLHFHSADTPLLDLDVRALQYNMPDKPGIETKAYIDAGLYREFIGEKRQMNVELYLKRLGETTAHAYGMMHWGDAPDMGYTTQGRARGDYVWTNNEYDYPHQCMIEYARTGNRAYLDRLLVAAEHWRDVDVCHFSDDPLLMGGQHMHSKYHVEVGCKPSHEWVEGLWDYYHLTGDEFARQTVLGIAENVNYVLVNEIFPLERYTAAREAGWALRTFSAMYLETGDEKWLEHCDRIVDYFTKWRADYGAWLQPYTDHTMVRVPFMISVACVSLMMYYRIRPSELIRDLIVTAMDDVLENCYSYDGVLYYKELPSLQRTGTNPIAMQALTHCWELTGDKKYLERALVMFRMTIFLNGTGGSGHHGGKVPSKDSVVCAGASPKSFAQYYPCLATIYKALMDNDMLPADFCTAAAW